MKIHNYILMWVIGLCICIPTHSKEEQGNHLSRFEFLLQNGLLFYEDINSDSIIAWEKELSAQTEIQKNKPLYFSLKHIAALAYGMRGDVSMATEYAKQIFEEAKSINSDLGRAIAYATIADSYYHSHMYTEAYESYQQACALMRHMQGADPIKALLLPRHITSLLKSERFDEAQICIQELEGLAGKVPATMLNFHVPMVHAIYEIKTGNPNKAEGYLKTAESVAERNGFEHHLLLLQYVKAVFCEEKGDYKQALQRYTLLEQNIRPHSIVRALNYAMLRARLLNLLGNSREACLIYQQVYTLQDSISAQSYLSQMNETRVRYYVDQIEIENKAQLNRTIRWGIIAIACLIVGIILFALNVRKQKRSLLQSKGLLEKAKAEAEKAIRTKSVLLSNMSHEIRTPLNALSGFSAILTEENIDEETRLQCNDIILQNSELLLKLINDVIDMSNLELGALEFTLKQTDAIIICRNVIDTVERVKQTRASVSFRTELPTLELYTDDQRLQQVLINLLINATKFTPSGSIVLEVSKESEQMALFTVTDTGSGIPLAQQGQIFNRFEKLNEGAQGTGLGLSISQLIIERLGGKIWIDPAYSGGARFLFTHPIPPTQEKEEEA